MCRLSLEPLITICVIFFFYLQKKNILRVSTLLHMRMRHTLIYIINRQNPNPILHRQQSYCTLELII